MTRLFTTGTLVAIFLLLQMKLVHATDPKEVLFLKNHIVAKVHFPVLFAEQELISGDGDMTILHRPGIEVGGAYRYNFGKVVALEFGINAGIKLFAYEVNIPLPLVAGEKEFSEKNRVAFPFLSLPLGIDLRFPVKEKSLILVGFGADMNVHVDGQHLFEMYDYEEDDSKTVFRMNADYANHPLFNCHLNFGYGLILENQNIVEFIADGSFGFTQLFEGKYQFFYDDKLIGTGKITSDNMHVAVGINYVFSRAQHLVAHR